MRRINKVKNNQNIEVIQLDMHEFEHIILVTLYKLRDDLNSFSQFFCFLLFTLYISYYSISCDNIYSFIFYESLLILCYMIYLDLYYWRNSNIIYERINYGVNEHLKTLDDYHEYITDTGLVIEEVEIPSVFIECSISLFGYIYYKYIKKIKSIYINIIK